MIEFDLRIYQVSIPVWFDWEDGTVDVEKLINSFQFQYGSIGRPILSHETNQYTCFNSSMVRLGAWADFSERFGIPSFNSSMVRLGENKAQIKEATLVSFQFQYGSIGRIHCRVSAKRLHQFQFQYGSIGRD